MKTSNMEGEIKLRVRNLEGTSQTIFISPYSTIRNLKQLVKQSFFLPAQRCPSFRLFFKGAEMSPENRRIGSYSIEEKDSIFMQLDRRQSNAVSYRTVIVPSNSVETVPVNSLKRPPEIVNIEDDDDDDEEEKENVKNVKTEFSWTWPDSFDTSLKENVKTEPAWTDSLDTSLVDIVDERVFKGSDCLTDSGTGKCLLSLMIGRGGIGSFVSRMVGRGGIGSGGCTCPSWLKTTLKAFAFVNVFSGSLEMQSVECSWSRLAGAMKKLKVSDGDVKRLSLICPDIVKLGRCRYGEEYYDADAIVIVDDGFGDFESQNGVAKSRTMVMGTITKRDIAFKTKLSDAVRKLIGKKKTMGLSLTLDLEDLLIYMKEVQGTRQGEAGERSEAKRARPNGYVGGLNYRGAGNGRFYCCDTKALLPSEMINHLKGSGYQGQIRHVEVIKARVAVYAEIPDSISETTRIALKRIGASKLYSHQAESIQASLSGKSVVVATMTSSGKSLCYNIPVLEALSQNLSSCALYLFPTKALAQDQLRALSVMLEGMDDLGINVGVYDGDTCEQDRNWLRENSRLLVTNPDMLHMSILPVHKKFHRILSNVKYVVIDEAHAYKGAFGCHTALILRRLRRLCRHVYGTNPSFIFSTATSGNPREHAMELSGFPSVELIKNDGSPSGSKLFVLWNPPSECSNGTSSARNTEDITKHKSSSPVMELSHLFAEMVQHKLRCIAFCKTRKLCELVLVRTREILQTSAPHLVDSISSYRGGYTAEDRRRIEREFFGGKLCGVAATNALELGIDVGHIDATLHLGFPGNISSLWQQAGRSGRRERPSLAVYVAFAGPLDQYFMKFPNKLFKTPIESCHIDAQNKLVLEQHLSCAAVEHPLSLLNDDEYFGSGLLSALSALTDSGCLYSHPFGESSAGKWTYIGRERRPAYKVSIRAIETEKYKVIDQERDVVLEEIEESKAFFQVYKDAAYMHQGKTYLVKDLNVVGRIALCEQADLTYYTRIHCYIDVRIIGGDIAHAAKISESKCSITTAQANNCEVTFTWPSFDRISLDDKQLIESVEISPPLPKYRYQTQAVWVRVPHTTKETVDNQGLNFHAGVHAASHAICNVVPLHVRCNASDLGSECSYPPDTVYIPERILLYDKHTGGSGISAQVQPLFRELLTAALDLLKACRCRGDTGCPSCVQVASCVEYNEILSKSAAVVILTGLIDEAVVGGKLLPISID